jgi:hypothetical protein
MGLGRRLELEVVQMFFYACDEIGLEITCGM